MKCRGHWSPITPLLLDIPASIIRSSSKDLEELAYCIIFSSIGMPACEDIISSMWSAIVTSASTVKASMLAIQCTYFPVAFQ